MTLLTFKNKYIVQSSTNITTNSTSYVDDTAAIQTFSLSSTQTVLVIYESYGNYSIYNSANRFGVINAISVDGIDRARSCDSSGSYSTTYVRNMPFWIGTLSAGSHTIKGRFAVPDSTWSYTIKNRILLIYIFDGNEFQYIDDSVNEVRWADGSWSVPRDDIYAVTTFTPSGPCKALYMYNCSNNYGGGNEWRDGKMAYINIAGVDYSQADKSNTYDNSPDSVFTCYANSLSATSTTVKGRFRCPDTNYVKVNNRQLGVLLFDNSTLLDSITSDTQVSTYSNLLVNDPQATISRTTTDSRELLVVAFGTKRKNSISSWYGEAYGIAVDGSDKQLSRSMGFGSPYPLNPLGPESEPVCWAQTLSSGSHAIQGRLSNNNASDLAIIDSRRIFAFWLSIPSGSLSISSTPSGAEIYLALSPGTPTDRGVTTIPGGTTISNLSPGTYNILLRLTGYQDWTGTATVSSGITTPINATFAGSLNISSTPSGATIYIDNVLQTGITTPAIITGLSNGAHTLKLTLSNYLDLIDSFNITAGTTTVLSETLIPSAGSLNISSTPSGARIYIDNIDQGMDTPNIISNLTPVSHNVKLTLTNYDDYTTTVTILSNQTITLSPNLSLSPGITKIQASPSFVQPSYVGEIIDIGILKLDWIGSGIIILEKTIVYDRLVLTGPNGIFDHIWTPCGAIIPEGPFDITNIFTPGYNEINTKIYNVCGGNIGTVTGSIDITGPITLACPTTPKYSGDTIILEATPKDGIGPYYVEFSKDGSVIDPVRLGGSNPIYNAPENTTITRTYQLTDEDVRNALTGTMTFSVFMSDSCPTGAKTCTQDCIVNIGCIAPVCNFTVT